MASQLSGEDSVPATMMTAHWTTSQAPGVTREWFWRKDV